MKVLLLGSGGREHALAWKLAQSHRLNHMWVCPGNPGTATLMPDRVENRPISATDTEALLALCREEGVNLCIIGPEQPLVEGVADALREAGIPVLGPGQDGARLEGSKAFSKQFMLDAGIPTAPARIFSASDLDEARAFVADHSLPVVIKADGLAAGKGVVVATRHEEAREAVDAMLHGGKFGAAGAQVLVEEFMPGLELSYFVLTDGRNAVALPEAQDHKRAYDGDLGPNTGGMGAYSPVPLATPELKALVEDTIVAPTLAALHRLGIDYRGFLFIGLMIGDDGKPRVVEYNCRLGDPETQVILPRIEGDFLELCHAAATGRLADITQLPLPSAQTAATVVLASEGYPEFVQTGRELSGLAEAAANGALIFEAGTAVADQPELRRSSGGRVLTVTGVGETLPDARKQAYEALGHIRLEGSFYRKDIGHKA